MFYERLNSLCQRNKTTISSVARLFLDVTSSTATGWKNGAAPRSDIVIKAAHHFGVSSDYLLGLSDVENPPSHANSEADAAFQLEPDEQRLIEALRAATPVAKAAAVASFFSILGVLQTKNTTTYSRSDAIQQNDNAV